jgi:hypothetical protein
VSGVGISRQILYQRRDRLEHRQQQVEPASAAERQLRKENERLKKSLAEKTPQGGFFKGALQKIQPGAELGKLPGEPSLTLAVFGFAPTSLKQIAQILTPAEAIEAGSWVPRNVDSGKSFYCATL